MNAKRIICLVALREEMRYIHDTLEKNGIKLTSSIFDDEAGSYLYAKNYKTRGISIEIEFTVMNRMGNIESAISSIGATGLKDSHLAIILGIAGTLNIEECKLGDVVMATSAKYLMPDKIFYNPSYGESSSKTFANGSMLRYRRDFIEFPGALKFTQRFIHRYAEECEGEFLRVDRNALPEKVDSIGFENLEPKLRAGCVLGSEWVIDDAAHVQFLRERDATDQYDWYKLKETEADCRSRNHWRFHDAASAYCVDMETYGFFKTMKALSQQNHTISIRGISDPCKDKSLFEGKSKGIRHIATANAVTVFLQLIEFMLNEDISAIRVS